MTAVWTYLRAGALAGLGSGLLAFLLEIALIPATDRTLGVALLIAAVLLPVLLVAGGLSGLVWLLVARCGRWLGRLMKRSPATGSATLIGMAALPLLLWLTMQLASGRQASAILAPTWRKALIVGVLFVLIWTAVWTTCKVAATLQHSSKRLASLTTAVLLLLIAAALIVVDARLFRRLYGYLHAMVALVYFVSGMLAMLALHRAFQREHAFQHDKLRSLGFVIVVIVAALGSWQSRRVLAADHHGRFVAVELTTVATKILAVWPPSAGNEGAAFLDLPRARSAATHQTGRFKVADANVVLVTIDALRADHLGAYGYKRPTSPNIDALAKRSVRFRYAYCQAPLTCYSVPSLHTGDYLRSTLALLPRPPATLAQMLSARGYSTAAFYEEGLFFCDDKRATSYGDNHFGFSYAETKARDAKVLTDRVLRFLQEHRAGQQQKKLFLWVHYFDAHEPYHRHPEYDFGARAIDRYDSEVSHADRGVGRLLAALGQLHKPTILVLSSDHGEEFREHGGSYHGSSLYEEQIRVPLLIAAPGLKPRVVDDPAQLVDVAPTLLAMLGLRVPESIRGRPLIDQLLGQSDRQRAAFSEVSTKKMVRLGKWKLIHDYRRSTYELYDLSKDPKERRNQIGRRPRQLARLRGRLQQWFDELRALTATAAGKQRPPGIDLGRIGDRRAVAPLSRLMTNPQTDSNWRTEAARLLGALQDKQAVEALWRVTIDDDARVAAEAAIALGEMKDRRARDLLQIPLQSSDNDVRLRAAIALARVDSAEATPVLLEALYSGNWELQNRAAHYLAFVGNGSAIKPLIAAAQLLHLRGRCAVALGHLGKRHPDPRILPFLLELVRNDRHPDVRHRALAAISFTGDRKAIRPLVRLLEDSELTWMPEALSRLGAVGRHVPGVDLSPRRQGLGEGWGKCHTHRSRALARYVGRTWCATIAPRATLQLNARGRHKRELLLRVRPLSPSLEGKALQIRVNGRVAGTVKLRSSWKAHRITVARKLWRGGANVVELRVSAQLPAGQQWLGVDYVLLAPAAKKKGAR